MADALAAPLPGSLLIFVSGIAGPPPDRTKDVVTSMWSRVVGAQQWFGAGTSPAPGAASGGAPEWHLDPPEIACVDMAEDAARRYERTLEVVNVNSPGPKSGLVRQWITDNDVFPVLVRPDGQRLVGLDQFDPARVRRFVRG